MRLWGGQWYLHQVRKNHYTRRVGRQVARFLVDDGREEHERTASTVEEEDTNQGSEPGMLLPWERAVAKVVEIWIGAMEGAWVQPGSKDLGDHLESQWIFFFRDETARACGNDREDHRSKNHAVAPILCVHLTDWRDWSAAHQFWH